MAEVATAYVSLLPSLKGFGKDLEGQVGSQTESVGKKAGKKLMGGIKIAGVTAAATVGGLLGTALTKGFSRLQGIEEARAKLTGLGHSTKAVDGIMKNALASVKGTAFGLDEAATTAASAVAAGIKPGKQLEGVLKTVADTATIAGASMGDMGTIFGSVAARGKLQGDDLMQLQSRGVPVLAFLAKHYGITAQAASKMVSKGQVDFKNFAAAMQENLGGAALKSGDTLKGAFANTMAALGRIGANLLSGVYPQVRSFFQGAITFLGQFEDKASVVGEVVGKYLAKGFQALSSIDVGDVFSKAVDGAQRLREKLDPLIQAAIGFGRSLVDAGRTAGPALLNIGKALLPLAKGAATVAIGALTVAFRALGPVVKAAAAVLGVVGDFAKSHGTAFRILTGAIIAGVAAWKAYQIATAAVKAVQLGLTAASYGAAGATYATGAASKVAAVSLAAQKVATFAVSAATKVWAAGQWLLNAALSANPIGLVVLAIAALVGAVILAWKNSETFRNIVTAAWNGIKAVVSAVVGWFTTAVPAAWNAVKNATSAAWNAIKAATSAVWNAIKSAVSVVVGGIKTYVGTQVRLIVGAWDFLSSLPGKVGGFFGKVKTAISDKLGEAVTFVKGIPKKIVGALGDLGALLYNAGKEIIAGLIHGITDKIGDIGRAMGKVASKIKGFLPGSPVREGPLRSWNNGGAGKRLVGLLADGLADTSPVDRAMTSLTSRIAVGGLSVPTAPAVRAGTGAGGSGQPLAVYVDGEKLFEVMALRAQRTSRFTAKNPLVSA